MHLARADRASRLGPLSVRDEFPGQKELVTWFRTYLIIAGRDSKLTESQRATGLQTVNIYDIKNKLVGACGAPRSQASTSGRR